MASAQGQIVTIEEFINSVGTTKAAAEPLSEPGSIGGPTSHPVKNVDDRLEKAKEGERSKENAKDVKEDQGPPSVENAPEAKAASAKAAATILGGIGKKAEGTVSQSGSAEGDQLQIGTKKAPTGEDAKSETSSAKAGKNDPGSTHPARTDNTELDGHKYAFDSSSTLEHLAGIVKSSSDNLLGIINGLDVAPPAGAQAPPAGQPKTAAAPAGQADPQLAYLVGDELAGIINGTMDKTAADQMVRTELARIAKLASDKADCYIHFATGYRKAAESGGGGTPAGGSPMPGGSGGDPSGAMSSLGGGGDPSGGAAPPGGAEGAAGGGDGGMQEIMQLIEQLKASGMSDQEIEQLLTQAEGGAGGAPPGGAPPGGAPPAGPMGGGAPPSPGTGGASGGAGPGGGMEVSSSAKNLTQAEKQSLAREFLTEVISRSRKK